MTSTPLPLDWTRLSRKDDCPDVLCSGCLPTTTTNDDATLVPLSGWAILCLPDAENDWFQGYFIAAGRNDAYKLLCIQQDNADPCLQCDDYQLWTVTLYHPTIAGQKQQQQDYRNVISRGGDSVCWHHENIRFRADAVHTGTKSHRLVERYFGGLLQTLCDDVTDTVQTVMPNVAIVTGDMTIWIQPVDA